MEGVPEIVLFSLSHTTHTWVRAPTNTEFIVSKMQICVLFATLFIWFIPKVSNLEKESFLGKVVK